MHKHACLCGVMRSSGTGAADRWELPCGCWGLPSGRAAWTLACCALPSAPLFCFFETGTHCVTQAGSKFCKAPAISFLGCQNWAIAISQPQVPGVVPASAPITCLRVHLFSLGFSRHSAHIHKCEQGLCLRPSWNCYGSLHHLRGRAGGSPS